MAELNLSPDEWIGYSGCTREKAEYLFREKYGYEGELDVRVTAGAILVRPKAGESTPLKPLGKEREDGSP